MSNPQAISVIIPVLNEEKYLPILLRSLSRITYPMEIIVVDGASTDKTVAVAESMRDTLKGKSLQVILLDKCGIALQRNTGAKLAQNEVLLFCDADIIAPSDIKFKSLVDDFVNGGYVVASSRIAAIENLAGAKVLLTIAYRIQKLLALTGKAYCAGAFLLTTKSTFMTVGGFDETLRISEDVDYSIKASKIGTFKIYDTPIKASLRRVRKYGYAWIFANPRAILDLIIKGKQTEEKRKIHYPFGEF